MLIKNPFLLLLSFFFLLNHPLSINAQKTTFDLLIRNGKVIDGSGNPWFRADIGIVGGKIAAIGRFESTDAKRTIDASGMVVSPGFIDVHTHAEREAQIPVEISHFKISFKPLWGKSTETVAMVEKARQEGIDVNIDQYPYTASSTNMGTMLPSWALA